MNRFRLFASLCLLFFVTLGFSQVDPQFLPLFTDYPKITATAIQPDGKILLSGNTLTIGNVRARAVMRLNTDGSIDNTFQAPELSKDALISSIALDINGKILIGGSAEENKSVAMRLNPDGSKDASFTLASQINQAIIEIVPLSSGSYLISSFSTLAIAKVRSDGSLDGSFSTGAGPNAISGRQGDIAVQADGKIICVGAFTTFSNLPAKGIVRLNPDGSIDNTFQIGTGAFNDGNPGSIRSIAFDGDKIILSGSITSFNSVAVNDIVRLLPTGAVDTDFTYPGPTVNFFDNGIDKVSFHEGGILVAGLSVENAKYYYTIMKLKSNGTEEATFPVLQGEYSYNAGILDGPLLTTSGSAILFSGYFDQLGTASRRGIALLAQNGSINDSFNPSIGGAAIVKVSRIQADGKIIVGGTFNHVGNVYVNNLVRLNPNGSVDETFRSNLGRGFNLSVNAIEILPNGKILVGGTFYKFNDVDKNLLVRLNQDGTLDPTFIHGISIKYVGYGINTMKVLPSGKILIGGLFYYPSYNKFNLARLLADGAIDPTFNDQMLTTDEIVNTLAVQSSDHILVGGVDFFNSNGFMKRATADGAVVNTFGAVPLPGNAVNVIKVLPNDDFLMAGYPTVGVLNTTPNPLFQFGKEGNLVDKLSVAVYEGSILDIEPFDHESFLLSGSFKRINTLPITGLAKVKLTGSVEPAFDFAIDGEVHNLEKDNSPQKSFYAMGKFFSFNEVPSFHIVKVNFDIPKGPTELAYTIDDAEGKIFLEWKDKSFNETGFQILRSEGAGFTAIDSVAAGAIKFTDSTAVPLKNYTYQVGAFNTTFQSSFSANVNVSTSAWIPPNAPTGFTYKFSSDYESIILTWTDESSNEKGFNLERSLDDAAFAPLAQLQKNTVSYSVPLTLGALYRFKLKAFNKFGASAYTETVTLPVIADTPEDLPAGTTIYPNPTADKIWVSQKHAQPLVVMVHDSQGRLVQLQSGNEQTIGVSLAEQSTGLYVVKVLRNNRIETFKVIKR